MALNARASQTGNIGEEFTVRHLENHGYKILDRNWRIKEGELDICQGRHGGS